MRKIFLAAASMMVAHFVLKTWNKLHEKPMTKEELYRKMKTEREQRKAMEPIYDRGRKAMEKLDMGESPCNGSAALAPARFV